MMDPGERVLALDEHSATARLVYLALRERGAMTAGELTAAAGISRPAASRTATELANDGWVRERTRDQPGPGPSPTEWVALVACPHCDERQHEAGLKTHAVYCDDDTVTSHDLSDMDPEDIGLDSEAPEPTEGLR